MGNRILETFDDVSIISLVFKGTRKNNHTLPKANTVVFHQATLLHYFN